MKKAALWVAIVLVAALSLYVASAGDAPKLESLVASITAYDGTVTPLPHGEGADADTVESTGSVTFTYVTLDEGSARIWALVPHGCALPTAGQRVRVEIAELNAFRGSIQVGVDRYSRAVVPALVCGQ